ncbi:hypothetical protein N9544_05675 [Flavobacteriales bacterium]|nr:hypothetical protein [Flavobacteriales bacterium]
MKKIIILFIASTFLTLSACKKEDKFIAGNTAPNYYGVPTIKVKNYVNRLFIDLSGREPLDVEMDSLVILLEANNLNFATREAIINNLQFDTTAQNNGDNFKQLFYLNIYGLQKARFLEGVPDAGISQLKFNAENGAITDSLMGNLLGYHWKKQQAKIYGDILTSDTALRNGSITFNEMCRRMCYNGIYDQINMNSFNYINAVFDNNLYRFPTSQEFTSSYNMVESDLADLVLGQPGASKYDFSKIITNSLEFNNGTVTWIYRSYLSRFPNSTELYHYSLHYQTNSDIAYIIREVMKTDEYANF